MEDRQISREQYKYGYQGKYAEKDEETGWNHFQLRDYDPIIGRWIARDPKNQSHSPYIGMGNNPATNVDVDGGSANSEFINPETGERVHVDDGINQVVTVENKDWKTFLKFLDLTKVISTPSQRFAILSKFGTTYMVGDMLDFSEQHKSPQNMSMEPMFFQRQIEHLLVKITMIILLAMTLSCFILHPF